MILATLVAKSGREGVFSRRFDDWMVDGLSLAMHFVAIPILQVLIVFRLLHAITPNSEKCVQMGWGLSFAAYALLDYAWYWNHRAFHAETKFWNLHQIHHSPKRLDVFVSSRNSLWSPFFMVYFWVVPVFLYLSRGPVPFLTFSAVGLVVNFWGHTSLNFPRGSAIGRGLSVFLIQPEDHHWHHSATNFNCNFGTVFNFWDRIHGTWYHPGAAPEELGFQLDMSLARKLFFPV